MKDIINILGLFPLTGNGGIASWTKTFMNTFPDNNHVVYPVDVSPGMRRDDKSICVRILTGFVALRRILSEVRCTIKEKKIDILHTTTSGNLGAFRDICVARVCRRYKVKTILHCRYGCISKDIRSKGLVGSLLRRSMSLFDQIWVLDQCSYDTLKTYSWLAHKVFLTPNSIEVSRKYDPLPKQYDRVAFIGNLIPTKGLYELVQAAVRTGVHLDIVGPSSTEVAKHVKFLAGACYDKTIQMHGKMKNEDAVRFMQNIDILALPTYYPSEAFPISIIEAMSLSKLVISCPRAAIPDMLTGLDGQPCGLLVEPKSSNSIAEAILWCRNHKEEADDMCRRAYEKVYKVYRMEVVYNLYRDNYQKLMRT